MGKIIYLLIILAVLATIGIYALIQGRLNAPVQTTTAQSVNAGWGPILTCINQNFNTNISSQFIASYTENECNHAYGINGELCYYNATCERMLGEKVTTDS
jgi:hypothetical protein